MRRPTGLTLVPALALLLVLLGSGCLERWVYVSVSSTPPGARVRVQGLPAGHGVERPTTPTGHFLRCTIDAVHPDVQLRTTDWSYQLSLPEHNDETLYALRRTAARFCADSRAEARRRPYRLHARMLRVTTEPGLHNQVLIQSRPSGAVVRDARTGKVLGRTPLRYTFVFYAPYTMVYRITVTAQGYPPMTRTVTAKTFTVDAPLDGSAPPPARPGAKSRPAGSPPVQRGAQPPLSRAPPHTPHGAR